ncbi:MAG TPA: glycoside hydrolase family 20 zincin-like fold domain-containing protein [Phnomibacter sp.]|nr:glycoside hydrolase family 20 zincin-like fold domain-containing protein [Phnomibacter sp.]
MKHIVLAGCLLVGQIANAQLRIQNLAPGSRTNFAAQQLKAAITTLKLQQQQHTIVLQTKATGKKESYVLQTKGKTTTITGNDASGVLYGALDWIDTLKKLEKYPGNFEKKDAPEMVLRGACIGVQKPYYLPGRTVYEYPYTPETFPWLYDKKLWIQYLDSMVNNRMNSLYLWNGHPFASLVKLKDYPYAVEVDEATFKKNEEMYRFLTTEADKRGIWVIQMFYNIIVSKPFAEHHKIKTQDRERPISPLIADYTRKSIAAFVEKYPNVGLMVCLGEAMEGVGQDDINWFTQTIIPGVQDGMKALGLTAEPPIVLRAHDTDAPAVMKAALPLYKNLYTEAKFNGEALTYAKPRGSWAELHQTLSKLGSVQIENVHILANLEPFRYGSPDFIQQSVIGMHEEMGGNGLHLYPQASYWDWPYSADSVKGKRLLQVERDWIWYSAWSRYAWKAKRNREDEIVFWSKSLASHYGCSEADGRKILEAYEQSGEIAPKLLRRFGITDGNRQTLTLGMLMTQLINPFRYGLFTLLYDGESPVGEMIIDYADKEHRGIAHVGETPVQVANEVEAHGNKAVAMMKAAAPHITKNKAEFDRLANDMQCYNAMAHSFSNKVKAALQLLKYKYSNNVADLEKAVPMLAQSLADYKQLAALTSGTYLYANSMQTQQRKIPMRGTNATFKHWNEMVPVFETELTVFQQKIDSLKSNSGKTAAVRMPFSNAAVNSTYKMQPLDSGISMFTDSQFVVLKMAPELKGMQVLPMAYSRQLASGSEITFSCTEPVKLLVGYFQTQRAAFTVDTTYLKAPELETNASADDYGQAEIKISNALAIAGMPPVNVHTYSFKAGEHTLRLGKGVCLVLGFVPAQQAVPVYDAKLMSNDKNKNIDWLFEK